MTPTCLVVDDEPTILRLVVLVLQDLGYETLAAPDAETAAGILAFRRPDLIITDVRLPGTDGVELTRHIKAAPPLQSTPVLLISAYEPPSHAGDGFLPKPFDIDGLTDFVAPYRRGR
ncbi:MAG TPA: response regulator [Thermoleophilia bacterium]|nr:response regulator [Thermoleophilia bacterium]